MSKGANYNQEETAIINTTLRELLPLATIKQFKKGSDLFVAIFHVTKQKIATISIQVSLTWIDEQAGAFQLSIDSNYNLDAIGNAMYKELDKRVSMN